MPKRVLLRERRARSTRALVLSHPPPPFLVLAFLFLNS